jgi:hypothetical protein
MAGQWTDQEKTDGKATLAIFDPLLNIEFR